MKRDENLDDLIRFAGGFQAYPGVATELLKRSLRGEYQIVNFKICSKRMIGHLATIDRYENRVQISGL